MMLLTVLLSVGASVAYGLSDITSGATVRQHPVAAVALWSQVAGLAVFSSAALIRKPEIGLGTGLWAGLAGVVGGLGVLAFYAALQSGPSSVVAPVAGSGGLIPIIVGVASGEALGTLGTAGVLMTVMGVVVVAASGNGSERDDDPDVKGVDRSGYGTGRLPVGTPGPGQPVPAHDHCNPASTGGPRRSILLSLLAASAFGTFFVVLDIAAARPDVMAGAAQADSVDNALAVALLVQVGVVATTGVAATRHSLSCLRRDRSLVVAGSAIAALDVMGDFSLTYAASAGPLSIVGPLGTLDPVVTVVVATLFLGERLRRLQSLGLGLAVVGTLAVSLASTV